MFDREYWYSKKNQKFLPNVDTFYYSVKLQEDFRKDSTDWRVEKVRQFCSDYQSGKDGCCFYMDSKKMKFIRGGMDPLSEDDKFLLYRSGCFARYYSMRLQCPDKFDIFIAPVVPAAKGEGESISPEIVVQIRSRWLWETCSVKQCVDESMSYVYAFCNMFSLHVLDIKENRIDYCFHTNAIQNPNKYFSDEKIDNTFVTRLGNSKSDDGFTVRKTVHFKKNADPSVDYIAVGNRSDKCFLRIYNKTKEVVQEGYKGFFFYIWHFAGLISMYDRWCLEKAYKNRSWNYLDVARLLWAFEYLDLTNSQKKQIQELTEPDNNKYNYPAIRELANKLTEKITIIMNVEYQVMRAFTRSCELIPFRENTGDLSRIYDLVDNRSLIVDYLTDKTFRIVDPDSEDSNKSRRPMCYFWKRLRQSKGIDQKMDRHQLHLMRNYAANLDLDIRKKKAIHSISSVAFALTHDLNTGLCDDMSELLAILNDNDLHEVDQYKKNFARQYTEDKPKDIPKYRKTAIIDTDTGEIINRRHSEEG